MNFDSVQLRLWQRLIFTAFNQYRPNVDQVWDLVWREILQIIIEGGHVPDVHFLKENIVDKFILAYPTAPVGRLEGAMDREKFRVLSGSNYWKFRRQLRAEEGGYFCVVLCGVHFDTGSSYWFEQQNDENVHAEEVVLLRVRAMDAASSRRQLQKKNICGVEIFMSWSPCKECADKILSFSEEFKKPITIKCSSLYRSFEFDTRQGLQRLCKAEGISFSIFTEADWNTLKSHLRSNDPASW